MEASNESPLHQRLNEQDIWKENTQSAGISLPTRFPSFGSIYDNDIPAR